jgi:transcriptional regulator with XRE-family HTH domain
MNEQLKTPQELQIQLGKGVRAVRISQGLTQRDLARKAGVSPKAVAQLERAEGSAVETLVRVLRSLKVTDFIEGLAPTPQVSPLALLRSPKAPQRVRHRRPRPNP